LSLNFFAISLKDFSCWQQFFAFPVKLLEELISPIRFPLFRKLIALLILFFAQSSVLFPHSLNLSIDLIFSSVFPLFEHFLQLCMFLFWSKRFFLAFVHYIVKFDRVFWSI
jgi:hypothetical protein